MKQQQEQQVNITEEQMRAYVLQMIQSGKLMDFAQSRVDELAGTLVLQFPEVAARHPLKIGAMAKATVVGELLIIAYGSADRALETMVRKRFITEAEAKSDGWKGTLFGYLASKVVLP